MARPLKNIDEQIKKLQSEAWSLAEQCDTNQLKLKDRLMESGMVLEEAEMLRKLFEDDTNEEVKKEYAMLLNLMIRFYKKHSNTLQVLT